MRNTIQQDDGIGKQVNPAGKAKDGRAKIRRREEES
jgi:hypothetical protein